MRPGNETNATLSIFRRVHLASINVNQKTLSSSKRPSLAAGIVYSRRDMRGSMRHTGEILLGSPG